MSFGREERKMGDEGDEVQINYKNKSFDIKV